MEEEDNEIGGLKTKKTMQYLDKQAFTHFVPWIAFKPNIGASSLGITLDMLLNIDIGIFPFF